ncbi:MAG: hypothetical protein IKJ89_05255 [Kiritimatiellae bacterium]|nr:hypothetical protein [Kiritimatiellia bacterium]
MIKSRFLFFAAVAAVSGVAEAARPVARWDVVPYQRIDGVFKAGVVAFHDEGAKVVFDVAGKKFTAEEPKLNDRTGVWEYFVPINVSKLPDGPISIKATATSLGSAPESFELPELPLYANAKKTQGSSAEVTIGPEGSLKDAISKAGDGGTVYLKKGVYSLNALGGKDRKFWTTITAAPGEKCDEVELSAGRPGADKLRFKGVTLFCNAENVKYASIIGGENGSTCCWLDDCRILNKKGRWAANSNVFGNRMRGYVTGGETFDMANGPGGTIQRGHYVHHITSDVWTGSDCLVVNCRCDDVDPGKTGAHPDFHQSHAVAPHWVHDVILYNVSGYDCKCQGLFGIRLRDSAFINVSFKCDNGMYSQYSDDMENVIFAHITLVNQTWLWREGKPPKGTFNPKDVRVLNCVFAQMGGFAALANGDGTAGLKVHHNAFYGKDKKGRVCGEYGTETLRIERAFADEAKHHYALPKGSPALKHGVPLQCVPADINGKPYPSGPRPCGAYAE